jgi:hypothetical protein
MVNSLVQARLAPLITGGVVATCATLDAEALYSARGPAEYEQIRADRRSALEYVATDDEQWQALPPNVNSPAPDAIVRSESPTYSPPFSPASIG